VSITGKYYRSVQYVVERDTGLIDYEKVRDLALSEKPRLIYAGGSAYPRILDFEMFGEIAREASSIFVADIAHISGLVSAGVHPDPVPHADVVSTTTHKMLRGPRGAILMCKDEHRQAIDKAVFPGLQGGPHNHTTAAIAVALKEASTPEFKAYAEQVVSNAKALAAALLRDGFELVSGGTDNHLLLIDMTNKGHPGKVVSRALNKAGIVCNCNAIPYDPRKPFDPSGIRIGTPSITSRGMKEPEMERVASWINQVVENIDDDGFLAVTAREIAEFCQDFPPPGLGNERPI
jgi:glycine hydroxymethyltransferase